MSNVAEHSKAAFDPPSSNLAAHREYRSGQRRSLTSQGSCARPGAEPVGRPPVGRAIRGGLNACSCRTPYRPYVSQAAGHRSYLCSSPRPRPSARPKRFYNGLRRNSTARCVAEQIGVLVTEGPRCPTRELVPRYTTRPPDITLRLRPVVVRAGDPNCGPGPKACTRLPGRSSTMPTHMDRVNYRVVVISAPWDRRRRGPNRYAWSGTNRRGLHTTFGSCRCSNRRVPGSRPCRSPGPPVRSMCRRPGMLLPAPRSIPRA
jgi:hypothetical protein